MESLRTPPVLVAGWNTTLMHWTRKDSHDTLLAHAVKHNQLAWLATRYREAARSNPHDPIARDRLKGVQRAAAMIALATPLRETAGRSYSALAMLLMAFAFAIGLGLWSASYVAEQRATILVSHQP